MQPGRIKARHPRFRTDAGAGGAFETAIAALDQALAAGDSDDVAARRILSVRGSLTEVITGIRRGAGFIDW